jgi:hypothetical protein
MFASEEPGEQESIHYCADRLTQDLEWPIIKEK